MSNYVMRPDGRAQVRLPEEDPGEWPKDAARLAAKSGVTLIAHLTDERLVSPAEAAGFRLVRREQVWRIPLGRVPTADTHAHTLRTALEVDIDALTGLDNAIRGDIPGTEGWVGTARDTRETLADEEFDPALYLVAEHRRTGTLDGLVRVWWRTPYPRLGCVGVRREWRRTRLAAMLLGAVAAELQQRGVAHIMTETDETNWGSHMMARRSAGVQEGTLLEMVRDPNLQAGSDPSG